MTVALAVVEKSNLLTQWIIFENDSNEDLCATSKLFAGTNNLILGNNPKSRALTLPWFQ